MALIDVNKLKVGVTFVDENGDPYKVLKYDFSKIGRGGANIKAKAKNLLNGSIVTKSYQSGNRVEEAVLEKKQMQYLYKDGEKGYFMDPFSFEQIEMSLDILGDDVKYIVEGENVWVMFWGEKVIGVDVPASVVLKVVKTEDWVKGNSATNIYKPAELETGLQVLVPLFIKEGEKVKINTSTGAYTSRANE